jgi:UDP-N-acetylmuramyl pentapeptide phosphotransferase/UDP-N-acetylglucosamine-1-phosphate transferase
MNENLIFSFGIIGISFFLTLGLTAWVRQQLLNRLILDQPNQRSSHKIPIPRGGGWALLIVIIPSVIGCAFVFEIQDIYAGLLAGLLLLILVSWLDDRKGVHPMLRLLLHIVAAYLGSFAFRSDQTLFANHLPYWLDRTLMILGWAWFINLYNFMDGIDGMTGVETITIATGACVIMVAIGTIDPFFKTLTLILTGTSLGFLAFNWHPAKIFLGDVGSIPLGFLTGYLLLMPAVEGYHAPAIILPLYYLTDSGITIAKRALRGEKIWQAHRQHFYQRAAQGLGRHDKVVFNIIAANAALLGTAIFSVAHPLSALALGAAIVANLLEWMHKAGKENV